MSNFNYILEQWSVSLETNGWQAPELLQSVLVGKVYGHPDFEDGKTIRTGPITDIKGKLITTYSGSVYKLGKVNPEYVNFLKENNYPFDEENPIQKVDERTPICKRI